MVRADRHNEVELNYLPAGTLTYMMGGRRVTIPANRLALFWAATPHQIIDLSGDRPYTVVTIPLAWFLQWKLPDRFMKALMAGEALFDYDEGRSRSDNELFNQWHADLSAESVESIKIVQLEMEARLRRMAFSYTESSQSQPGLQGYDTAALSKIEHIAAYVATHYTEPVSLADIASAVGLHPNYVASIFKKTFGVTLNAHITEYRVSHAQRLLVTTDQKVLSIALASGFSSLSRFNAAFKTSCGCTPREYRKRHALDSRR